jgi:hypothetical protein
MNGYGAVPVWSKNSSRLAVSKKLNFSKRDECIEGTTHSIRTRERVRGFTEILLLRGLMSCLTIRHQKDSK